MLYETRWLLKCCGPRKGVACRVPGGKLRKIRNSSEKGKERSGEGHCAPEQRKTTSGDREGDHGRGRARPNPVLCAIF